MDESFDSALMDALTADSGAPEEAPAEQPEATETTEQEFFGATNSPEFPDSSAPVDEDDLRSILERQKAEYPEQAAIIDAIHREFQRGLTPKLQQAAELRKAYEGVDPQLAAWARQMNELALSRPAEAAAALMAEAQRLQGQQQAAAQEPDFEWATDYDRQHHEEIQQLKQFQQQMIAERNEAVFNAELDKQAKELGVDIPYEERYRVLTEMHKDRAPAQAAKRYWRDLYWDKALRKVRDEAASVMTKKAGMSPPPSSLASRAGQGEAPAPASLEDAIRAEYRSRGIA